MTIRFALIPPAQPGPLQVCPNPRCAVTARTLGREPDTPVVDLTQPGSVVVLYPGPGHGLHLDDIGIPHGEFWTALDPEGRLIDRQGRATRDAWIACATCRSGFDQFDHVERVTED